MTAGPSVMLLLALVLAAGSEGVAVAQRSEANACAARQQVPEHVRPLDCALASVTAAGLARSATFRDIVARIAALNGIVYVQPSVIVQSDAQRVLDGALIHRVSRVGSRRVLVVVVVPGRGDRSVRIMAHEFQHVTEVLASSASTEAEIDTLFERIGVHAGALTTETTAAIDAERAVGRELSERAAVNQLSPVSAGRRQ